MSASDTKKVLIVEDDDELANLYKDWLPNEFSAGVVNTGTQFREKIDDTIDVILMDRRLPDMTGDKLVSNVRSSDITCSVVMVSSVSPDGDIIGVDIDDYVTKPVSQEKLLRVLKKVFNRHQYNRQLQFYVALLTKRVRLDAENKHIDETVRSILDDKIGAVERQLNQPVEKLNFNDVIAVSDSTNLSLQHRQLTEGEKLPNQPVKMAQDVALFNTE
ncbi:MAG: response regulator transcription factor [Halobacteriaceae archaeon]